MRPTALLLIAPILFAQTFEVASVKVNHSDSGRSSFPYRTKGKLTANNATMLMMLQSAYGLTSAQISGPSWITSDRFDIEGKEPSPADDDADLDAMMKALLQERFHRALHRDNRNLSALVLEAAKNGPGVIHLRVPSAVALYVLNEKRAYLMRLQQQQGLTVNVLVDDNLADVDHEIDRISTLTGEEAKAFVAPARAISTSKWARWACAVA